VLAAALVGVIRASVGTNYTDHPHEVIAIHEALKALVPFPAERKKAQRYLRDLGRDFQVPLPSPRDPEPALPIDSAAAYPAPGE
jgi:hypothetical protein